MILSERLATAPEDLTSPHTVFDLPDLNVGFVVTTYPQPDNEGTAIVLTYLDRIPLDENSHLAELRLPLTPEAVHETLMQVECLAAHACPESPGHQAIRNLLMAVREATVVPCLIRGDDALMTTAPALRLRPDCRLLMPPGAPGEESQEGKASKDQAG
ncbi:hypothetical protein ACFOPQ_19825 [Deinococcus antarcticus]|uniref:Uncharacterized protein n=1 Tax=Deinococcus antarcticus TaxID=1298767 RepID=A0ABV8ACK2_9DEIO